MVAHPDRVCIGEPQAEFPTQRAVVFDDDVAFAADVLSRGLDVRPNTRFKQASALVIDHEGTSVNFQKE